MGSQRGKIQTTALWVWWDLRYRRLSLSLRKFPMWEHRLHLAQTLPVTRYVGSFLLPVICRCWLHLVRTVLQFGSWVNEEGILKDTVPPTPRSLFWNRVGRPSHIYVIWWQANLQRCEDLLNKTQIYSRLWRLLGLVAEQLVGGCLNIGEWGHTVKYIPGEYKTKKRTKLCASSPELA